jgi:hypothetical protein
MTTVLAPVYFEAPLVAPTSPGLYGATNWTEEDGPLRWLDGGVQVRPHNYGGESAVGRWQASWCAGVADLTETDLKTGVRPAIPDPFEAITVWAYDECDLTAPSRDEVRTRAAQNLRLMEQPMVEQAVATRLLADAGAPAPAADLVEAVGTLEAAMSLTCTQGYIHASAGLAATAQRFGLIRSSGGVMVTPLGHRWVFGGGYVEALGDTLVATSPTFGWRSATTVRETIKAEYNEFVAIAERAVLVGYEKCVAAATITP